jgi:hypothetical protein
MKWLNHFWHSSAKAPEELIRNIRLSLSGWSEDPPRKGQRRWRNSDDEALVLAIRTDPYPCLERGDELEVRRWAREFAQSRGGGLIEVLTMDRETRLIFKRLEMPAYYYIGVLVTCVKGMWPIWTTTACEFGTTGVREAVVTATLMNEGKLSPDEYERHWAQDPYEPAYRGVDRSVLRFMSDDESYDQQFPQHPLSRTLAGGHASSI